MLFLRVLIGVSQQTYRYGVGSARTDGFSGRRLGSSKTESSGGAVGRHGFSAFQAWSCRLPRSVFSYRYVLRTLPSFVFVAHLKLYGLRCCIGTRDLRCRTILGGVQHGRSHGLFHPHRRAVWPLRLGPHNYPGVDAGSVVGRVERSRPSADYGFAVERDLIDCGSYGKRFYGWKYVSWKETTVHFLACFIQVLFSAFFRTFWIFRLISWFFSTFQCKSSRGKDSLSKWIVTRFVTFGMVWLVHLLFLLQFRWLVKVFRISTWHCFWLSPRCSWRIRGISSSTWRGSRRRCLRTGKSWSCARWPWCRCCTRCRRRWSGKRRTYCGRTWTSSLLKCGIGRISFFVFIRAQRNVSSLDYTQTVFRLTIEARDSETAVGASASENAMDDEDE